MPFIGKQSTSNSQITNYTTTVGSGGQTNFTVVIEGGDETHVYLNGVLLKETTDYTVSSTQVSLVSPAVENDIVEIKVFRSFALVDAVRATGGTFSGDVAVTGDLTVDTDTLKVNTSTNQVGIGTDTPSNTLEIKSSSPQIRLTDSDGGYSKVSGTDGNIFLQADEDNTQSNSKIDFRVDGVQRVVIDSSGSITTPNGEFNGTIGTSASGFGLITEADQYRINTNLTGTSGTISSGWERVPDSSFAKIGTGVDESGGVFTFSQTGIFLILVEAEFQGLSGSDLYGGIRIRIDQGSGYTDRAEGKAGIVTTNATAVASCNYIFDVTNTTNDKVIFERVVSDTTNVRLNGSPTKNQNSFTFIRLGNT